MKKKIMVAALFVVGAMTLLGISTKKASNNAMTLVGIENQAEAVCEEDHDYGNSYRICCDKGEGGGCLWGDSSGTHIYTNPTYTEL